MAYRIEFAGSVKRQMQQLEAGERALVFEEIERQLTHEPETATRHRKRLRSNPLAPWELRVRELRVFYDVDAESTTVRILAVGRKKGNVLWIGGEEIHL